MTDTPAQGGALTTASKALSIVDDLLIKAGYTADSSARNYLSLAMSCLMEVSRASGIHVVVPAGQEPVAWLVNDVPFRNEASAVDYSRGRGGPHPIRPLVYAVALPATPAKPIDTPAQEPVYGIIDPEYARIFTIARLLAWSEGYALMMHGSFTRDLDLIAVPWTDAACEPEHLVRRLLSATDLLRALHRDDQEPGLASTHPHGRLVWTLVFKKFGDPRFVDFSVYADPAKPTDTVQADSRQYAREVLERLQVSGGPSDAAMNWLKEVAK